MVRMISRVSSRMLVGLVMLGGLNGCATQLPGYELYKNYTAPQLLAAGESQLTAGKYQEALKYFEALEALHPFAKEGHQGQLDAIYAYYQHEDYESVSAAADRYIHLYPNGQFTDYVYYLKGRANFVKKRTWLQSIGSDTLSKLDLTGVQEAFNDFTALIKLFPASKYAKAAQMHLAYIRDLIAAHELQVGQFYLERQAYLAALNRANYVVKHLANSNKVKEALELSIKAYRALGLTKEAEQMAEVLRLNFKAS